MQCKRLMIKGDTNSVRSRYLNGGTCCSLSLHRQRTIFIRTCFDVHYNIRIAETPALTIRLTLSVQLEYISCTLPPCILDFFLLLSRFRQNTLFCDGDLSFSGTVHPSRLIPGVSSCFTYKWLPLKLWWWRHTPCLHYIITHTVLFGANQDPTVSTFQLAFGTLCC